MNLALTAALALVPALALAEAAPAPVPAYPNAPAIPTVNGRATAPSTPAPPDPVAGMSNAFRADLGLASPIGFLGMTYTHTFAEVFGLEAGVGWGVSGLQLSLMPKIFLGSEHHRFMLGIGPSAGIPTDRHDAGGNDTHPIAFLNAEIGYDLRTESGVSFQIAFGGTMIVSHAHWAAICFDDCDHLNAGDTFPSLRFGVGHWF